MLAAACGHTRSPQVELFEGMTDYHAACGAVPFSAPDCRAGMYKFLKAMNSLRKLWRKGLATPDEHHDLPYTLRPKAHMCQHIVEAVGSLHTERPIDLTGRELPAKLLVQLSAEVRHRSVCSQPDCQDKLSLWGSPREFWC